MQIRSSSFSTISERSNLCSRFHDLEIKTRIVQSDMTKLRVENKIKLHIVIIMKLDRLNFCKLFSRERNKLGSLENGSVR